MAATTPSLEFSPTKKWEDGLDKIPVDDQRYLDYCAADVGACERVLGKLELDDYARREMRLHTRLVSGITVTGFRSHPRANWLIALDGSARPA